MGQDVSAGTPPRWVRWGTLLGLALVAALVAITAIAVRSGATDPPVAGPVSWRDTAFAWANGPQQTLAERTAAWWAAPERLPADDGAAFTLTVRARLAAGTDPLAAWGVWIAGAEGARTLYAISAGGYWTIRSCTPGVVPQVIEDCPATDPEWRWRAFPRIRPPGEINGLVLHREPGGAVRLRVNAERLGAPVLEPGGTWGIWARGGAQAARVSWESASLAARATPSK